MTPIPPTERERCPTCDHELATVADQRTMRQVEAFSLCWRVATIMGTCSHPAIDWRQRCLAAEAQLAGGDVRPLVDALELRPEVAAFAQIMEAKLRANDHKGGWQRDPVRALLRRLREETTELADFLRGTNQTTHKARRALDERSIGVIGREAADVANFAMMIADVCGALRAHERYRWPGWRWAPQATPDKDKETDHG